MSAVRPAVVNVSVTPANSQAATNSSRYGFQRGLPPELNIPEPFRRFFESPDRGSDHREFGARPMPRPAQGVGSGFIIDPDGWIVTNHHVVDNAGEIKVTLHDGRKLAATLAGSDPKTDLAVLRVEADSALPFVPFGDSDRTRVGDWVLAVGNPFGLGGTVTAGIVSARGRDIGSGPYDDFIQIDAPINRGNSGGPLFNRRGEVVGINTAIFSPTGGSVGIGFAIPATLAEPLITDLRDDGKVERGWLGVRIQRVDQDLAKGLGLPKETGALVTSVIPGTPAASAGVKTGDVITEYAGQTIESVRDLTRAVAKTDAGTTTELTVWRDGKAQQLEASISEYPGGDQPARLAGKAEPRDSDARLGLSVAPATGNGSRNRGKVEGVVVTEVEPMGPAARHGLRSGDVILRAGTRAVNSPSDLRQSVQDAAEKDIPVVLLVKRDDASRFIAVPPGKARG